MRFVHQLEAWKPLLEVLLHNMLNPLINCTPLHTGWDTHKHIHTHTHKHTRIQL